MYSPAATARPITIVGPTTTVVAMASGLTDRVWTVKDIGALINSATA